MKKIIPLARQKFLILCAVAACVALLCPAVASATSILGSAQSFAALGYAGVSNTGTTTIYGDVGVDPAAVTYITGFETVTVTGGSIYGPGNPSPSARNDATIAKTNLGSMGAGTTLAADLGGLRLSPGVYTVPYGFTNLSGTLTLDGGGNANAFWVFQMPSSLITSSNSVVNVTNTGSGAGVYWNVGSSATLGTGTVFAGNILAYASVGLDTGAEILCGRAIALTGAVTLEGNKISNNNTLENFGTGRPDYGSYGFSGTPVPVPPTVLLLGSGLVGLGVFRLRRRAKKA